MARRAFKNMKKTIAALTVISMIMGVTITVFPTGNVNASVLKSVQNKRNVTYYGDWSIWGGQDNFYPKDLPADQLTNLNFAFLDFNANGDLIFCDKDAAIGAPVGMPNVQWGGANAGLINAFQDLRAANPNMKIGVSLGGWSKSGDFSTVAANSAIRAKFVENVMKFAKYANLDFIDLDWEYPGDKRNPDLVDNKNDEGTPNAKPEDKANYIILLQDLRNALDAQGKTLGKTYELSVALPVSKYKLDLGIDVAKLFSIVDYANLMTYDMNGAWSENSGHQAGLYANPNDPTKGQGLSTDEGVKYLISQGAPKDKIVIGAAYYTRGWEKVSVGPDAKTPGLYGKAEKINKNADGSLTPGAKNEAPIAIGDGGQAGGVWSYRSMDKLKAAYPGLTEYWDDTAKAPYLYNATTGAFFTYDNVRSIGEKTKYVNDNGLGGMISWMASQDKPTTSTKRDELTKASKNGLFGTQALPANEIVYSNLDISCSVTTAKDEWAAGGKYVVTIKNNEKLQETNETLKGVENAGESIKTPKFYIKNTGGTLTAGDNLAGVVTQQNGYTVVDVSGVYEGGVIEPGKSYSFTLNTTNAKPLVSDISSVEVAQHIYKGGAELNRQLVLGSTANVNTVPVIAGATNQTLTVGDAFNSLSGVTASDKEDGVLTSAIKVTGAVDTTKAGSYTLTYTVADSKGLTTTVTRVITVNAPVVNTAPTIVGATNKTINKGDTFDSKAGVTASDKEDGDLTSRIAITGTVDTSKAGNYTLTYTVTDSKGLVTIATRVITVSDIVVPNTAPTITGADNKTITVGDVFNQATGVIAIDKEDGVLTSSINVTGTVDTTKAGTYNLTYTVTDSKGLSTSVTRVITVAVKNLDTFNPAKVYVTGDKVIYNGVEYTAKYWTQGNTPDKSDAWARTMTTNTDGSKNYIPGSVYNSGDIVKYNNKNYKANWWTTSVPGSDSSWTAL